MKPARTVLAALSTLALVAAAATAHAQQAKPQAGPAYIYAARGDFATQSPSLGGTIPEHPLEWDARKGRWGLRLDVHQPTDRQLQGKDVQVGGYYRLTPRLHVGAGVSLGEDAADNLRKIEPQQPAPRVRLETTFKF
jgi:hypothetical protein